MTEREEEREGENYIGYGGVECGLGCRALRAEEAIHLS
jgi:hypothetical protein